MAHASSARRASARGSNGLVSLRPKTSPLRRGCLKQVRGQVGAERSHDWNRARTGAALGLDHAFAWIPRAAHMDDSVLEVDVIEGQRLELGRAQASVRGGRPEAA